MITAFDRTTCRIVRDTALAALRPAAESLGLGVEPAGGRFETHAFTAQFHFTVTATAAGVSGEEAHI